MKAILLIDHGSVRGEANEMLACVANLVQHMVADQAIVHFAHMELAEPSIAAGFSACVKSGATEVVVFPYMLSPGKHSISDIPRMVAEAARSHPRVSFVVTPPFGVASELAAVIIRRSGLELARNGQEAHCWNPSGREGSCGESCAANERDRRPESREAPAPQ